MTSKSPLTSQGIDINVQILQKHQIFSQELAAKLESGSQEWASQPTSPTTASSSQQGKHSNHSWLLQNLTNDSNSDTTGDLNDPTGPPHPGNVPISTLGQAVVNIGVDPVTGALTLQDFFVPLGYQKLNTGDKDFSSSGVTLLDPVTFTGGGVTRVALCGSKVGTLYVMDANNLGGYKMGM